MADILVQKDANNLIPKLGISAAERTAWALDYTIYDINSDGSRGAAYGPTRSRSKAGALTVDTLGAVKRGPDGGSTSSLDAINGLLSGAGNTGNARIDALIDAADRRSYTFAEALSLAPSNVGKWFWIPAVGDGGSWWFADPSGYLRPSGNRCQLVSRWGSVGSPLIAAMTGATTYLLSLPVQPVIPAGLLIPGQSKIEFEAWIKRTGTTGSAAIQLYLGLNNNPSTDFQLISETSGATDNLDSMPNPALVVSTSVRVTTGAFKQRYGTTGAAASYDSSVGAINTAVVNYGNIRITSANAADTFKLIGYRMTVEQ